MDLAFNDISTYNFPNVDQPFPFSDPARNVIDSERAEAESSIPQEQPQINELHQADAALTPSQAAQSNDASQHELTTGQSNRPSDFMHPAITEAAFEAEPKPNGIHPTQNNVSQETAPQQ